MMTAPSVLEIGSFQTLIRPTDAVVRDRLLHGVPALPEVGCLDAVYRAAELRGISADQLELRQVRFPDPGAARGATDRRLVFRTAPHGSGARLTVTVEPAGEDDAGTGPPPVFVECLLGAPGAGPAPEPLDVASVRRALASGSAASLDPVHRRLAAAGLEHGDFLRARGTTAELDGLLVAELGLGDAARLGGADFLAHVTFLEAATAVLPFITPQDAADGRWIPVAIERFRILRRSGDTVLARARVVSRSAEGDQARADVYLYDTEGQPVALLEGITARRDRPAAEPAERTVESASASATTASAPVAERGNRGPRPRRPLDIAIVGMSARLPGADDLDQFWRNLEAGHDAVAEVPADRWRAADYPTDGRPLGRFGAFLTDVDAFDPLFFRVPPSAAAVLDPQERLFLQSAYAAVENAGYRPQDFAAPHDRVGVFVGTTWADYRLIGAEAARRGVPVTVPSVPSSAANRVSYFFGFTGPSMAVDTACSSSLTALHLACRSIADGECDAALAGGVNLILHPDKFLLLNHLNMTSEGGRCRSYGAGGDGYVPGEGVGAFLLKPRERAVEDGDTIHGVILGSAVNHGGRAAGYTVPHPSAQADAVRRALHQAAVDPETIGYIEGHGTGTALGDPVEVVGLKQAFAGRSRPAALGSVKANIGHLEAAAGVAALGKTLLQIRNGRIAPSLHSAELNPEIDFTDTPFHVPQEVEEWPRLRGPQGEIPRRAGVSSFGAGGANAHLVLEEYIEPPAPQVEDAGAPELLVLSARNAERLREYAGRIAAHLRGAGCELPFRDVVRTLQAGRPALEVRLALVAASAGEAAGLLERHLSGDDTALSVGSAGTAGDAALLAERYRAGDLAGAADLWAAGATPDWTSLHGGPRRRVPLPGYPFERKRFWIEVPEVSEIVSEPQPAAAAPAVTALPAGPAPSDPAHAVGEALREFEAGLAPTAEELERHYPELDRYAALTSFLRLRELGLPAQGPAGDITGLLGIDPKFERFMQACLSAYERHGLVRRDGAMFVSTGAAVTTEDPARLRAVLLARFPEAAPFVRVLDASLAGYEQVLRGERSGAEVLFPQSDMDLMAGIYSGNRSYDFYNELLARFVGTAVVVGARAGRRPFRVLEIGAGTGGTSRVVLDELVRVGHEVAYQYTDIGGSFVAHGRRTFGKTYPFVSFRALDIDREPEDQGFLPGQVDLVLAANAIHAVTDIDAALARVRRLLAPGGMLVLNEGTADHGVYDATFGMLDGWHMYRDPERRLANVPLLSVPKWRDALGRTGFGDLAFYGPGLTGDAEPSQRVIVAGAAPATSPTAASSAVPSTVPAATAESDRQSDDLAAAIEPVALEIVAEALGVTPEEIRPEQSLSEYGVDSILAVKLVARLNERFALDMSPTVVFDYTSVRELAGHLAAEGGRVSPSAAPAAAPVPTPALVPAPAPAPVAAPLPAPLATAPTPVAPVPIAAPAATAPVADPPSYAPASAPLPATPAAAPESGRPLDIAIIGISGRFPGAGDTGELWRNLVAGLDSVGEIPPGRWNIDDHFQPWPPAPDKTYSRWGGYLDDIDLFDPLFFDIVPVEADYMDPQQRLFLQESWKALEDAGIDARKLRRSRVGVFAGAPASDYLTLMRQRGPSGSLHVFTGNSSAILPARVAYHLDVTGPCVAVDTACSSSLVALQQACQSIASGACEVALAGGVSISVTPEFHQLTSSLGMLSPTGRCRSFDAAGDGIVLSEGVGVAVLKPLDRALADGDPIHGVIKGIGINQDGHTNGITAPSARSQTELELGVYDRHGIDPSTIGYVEAHGTGTKLGDPIEIEALSAAFRRHTDRKGAIPIGSVKTNIGHASHAAGMAGLFKVLLAMRAGQLPPSLHFDAPNPLIDFPRTPFRVNTELSEWPRARGGRPRRAAISSFGFSGTNAHLVVEEYDDIRPPTRTRSPRALVTLSARTEESLRRSADALADFLDADPGVSPHDVAATTQTGRSVFEHRLAVLAGSADELRARLRLAAEGRPAAGTHTGTVDPDVRRGPALRPAPDADLDLTAAAWAAGTPFDFSGLYAEGGAVRRVHLPGYAFARERCWLPDMEPVQARAAQAALESTPVLEPSPVSLADRVRPLTVAIAAAELGLPEDEVDLTLPSGALGLDQVGRARTVEAVNRELGLDLPIGLFTVRTALADLVDLIVDDAAAAPAPFHVPTAVSAPPPVLAPAPVSAPVVAPLPAAQPQPTGPGTDAMAAEPLVPVAEDYLVGLLAEESRLPADRIRVRAPLQDYGIDSVLITKLNARLSETFGDLPSTLFFEYQTIRELAGYLAAQHPGRVAAVARERSAAPLAPAPAAVPAPAEAVAAPVTRVPAAADQDTPAAAGGRRRRAEDIAVIGMAGRYPMADDNDQFWANLLAGRDCIVEIPEDRWDHKPYLSDDPEEPGTTYAKWGGFLNDVDKFDARFFNIAPRDAEGMDPQQRLFLETAWAALEDGGYPPERARESARRRGTKDVGVFAGVNYAEYQLLVDVPIAPYWAVANRVSYHFGFNGPSLAVDTACSSSMTAIHLACESLRSGDCGYAVAGGVNVSIHPGKFLLLGDGQWASTDGRCRTFGAGGDGYVPGEGVVALVLKPLADAEEDGDRVYGVIRASSINQDGHTNGFSVPNVNAQADLIHEALTTAGVSARDVSYVEAHGTGTALGDPIEIAGLSKAYREFTSDSGYCAIGSAKSGIGHLEAAAGAAGLVKTLLQLEHETIAPSQHADPPNPDIDFGSSPFQVAHTASPWRRPVDGSRRLAAVSSFGAGGSNAHVIVSDAAPATPTPAPSGPELIVLSARKPERLEEQVRNLVGFLRTDRGAATQLADVAWTLQVGRESFEHRVALVARSSAELAALLEAHAAGRTPAGTATGSVRTHDVSGGESAHDLAYLRALAEGGEWSRIGELWTRGWTVDWAHLRGSRHGRTVSLPTYPFARERHWIVAEEYRRPGTAPVVAASAPAPALSVAEPAPVPAAQPVFSQPVAQPVAQSAPPQRPADVEPAAPAGGDTRTELELTVKGIFSDLTKLPTEELDPEADFLDFGFDSVTEVRMLNRLMKHYKVQIPATTIQDYNTINTFCDHLVDTGLVSAPAPVAAPVSAPAPVAVPAPVVPAATPTAPEPAPAADDADRLRAVLEAPAHDPGTFTRETAFPVESIFITGATGVLGGKLLHSLLTDTTKRINCLVRSEDTEQAAKRLRYFLHVYDPQDLLVEEFERRVTPVLGDVSRERLGLDERTWTRLVEETDLTIHNAAKTALVTFYENLAPVNVEGTARVIDFALRTKHKYLAYVSSFAALGDYLLGNNPPYTERDLEVGQAYEYLPYQKTKYHSEKLVRAASRQGLVWNIFRPGNILGESRSGLYPFEEVTVKGAFYDFFRTFIESGTGLLTSVDWDISPVDYVSDALLHLTLRRPSYRETYHLTNPDYRTLYDSQDYIREFGYDLSFTSIDEFVRMANEQGFRRKDTGEPYNSQTLGMIEYAIECWGRAHYEISSRNDCTYTREILAGTGIDCPPVRELIPVYLQHCVDVGYLPSPEQLGGKKRESR